MLNCHVLCVQKINFPFCPLSEIIVFLDGHLFSKRELFDVWRAESSLQSKNKAVFKRIMEKVEINDSDDEFYAEKCKGMVKNFTSKLASKWLKAKSDTSKFVKNNRKWLESELIIPKNYSNLGESSTRNIGRPTKSFSESSRKSKKRKIQHLLQSYTVEELTFAAETSLRISGRKNAADIVKQVADSSASTATFIKNSRKASIIKPVVYTDDEALALYIDGDFSKNSYILTRNGAKLRHANIYPSYHRIKQAKEACYPDTIKFTEISAEVELQALLDHTTERLLNYLKTDLCNIVQENDITKCSMIFKWGCDGSSGHSRYKQNLLHCESSDEYLFSIFIVPLQLYTYQKKSLNKLVLWQNDRPSSTRFCRPVKILFKHESNELISQEISKIENQISNLKSTKLNIINKVISVQHILSLTMIDGKTFSVVSQTSSSQTCGICGATPKVMNNLNKILEMVPDTKLYDYGISSLHAWIRCFECLLHISYRLEVKSWQIKDGENKGKVNERKKIVQNKLKSELGLLVDIPKPGYGTTNDGNTARRFFLQPDVSSACTDIDVNLIKRFSVILRAISSGFPVNIQSFENYTRKTAEKFVELYPWYYMPASVHKLLIHGPAIVKASVLPIGMYSEEALESRNKHLRNYREHHARKCSREKTITDMFHALLYTSDPMISSISNKNSRSKSTFNSISDEVKVLLDLPHEKSLPLFTEENDNTDVLDSSVSESD